MSHLSEAGWAGPAFCRYWNLSLSWRERGSVSWSLWSCTSCSVTEPEPGLHSDWWLGHGQGLWVTAPVPVTQRSQALRTVSTSAGCSSWAAMSNLGTPRSDFAFLCVVSRKARPGPTGSTAQPEVSSLLLTLSQRPASGMWEGLPRSAECTVSNLGGVEITGELGKEFTMKAMK